MLIKDYPHIKKQSGTSLVLSGGATKAFYFHLGVLRVLGTDDISSIVGSSAGAVLGAFLAAGVDVDTLVKTVHHKKVYMKKHEAWAQRLTSTMLFRPKYTNLLRQSVLNSFSGVRFLASLPRIYNDDILAKALDNFIKSQSQVIGFFDSKVLGDLFESVVPSNKFSDLQMPLFVVATALDSQKRAIFNNVYDYEDANDLFATDVPLSSAIQASTAVPGMFEPVRIDGKYYVDGEIKRTVSSDLGVNLADKVIISHTYQPLYLNGQGSVRDMGWYNIVKQSVSMVLFERIQRQSKILQEHYAHKDVMWIQPDPEDEAFFLAPEFSFDSEVQQMIMRSGEHAARNALAKYEMPQVQSVV